MSSFPHPRASSNTVSRRTVVGALTLAPVAALLSGCGLRIDDLTPPTPEPPDESEDSRDFVARQLTIANNRAEALGDDELAGHTAALLAAAGGVYVNAAETGPPPEPYPEEALSEEELPQGIADQLARAFLAVGGRVASLEPAIAPALADVAAGCSVLTRWWASREDIDEPDLNDLFDGDDPGFAPIPDEEAVGDVYGSALGFAYSGLYAAERAAVRLEDGARVTAERRVDDFDDIISALRGFLRDGQYPVPEPRAAYALEIEPTDAETATSLLASVEDGWCLRIRDMLGPVPQKLIAPAGWLVDSARARQDLTGELKVLRFEIANEAGPA